MNCFLFFLALLDPYCESGYGSKNPIESGSNHSDPETPLNPDPIRIRIQIFKRNVSCITDTDGPLALLWLTWLKLKALADSWTPAAWALSALFPSRQRRRRRRRGCLWCFLHRGGQRCLHRVGHRRSKASSLIGQRRGGEDRRGQGGGHRGRGGERRRAVLLRAAIAGCGWWFVDQATMVQQGWLTVKLHTALCGRWGEKRKKNIKKKNKK